MNEKESTNKRKSTPQKVGRRQILFGSGFAFLNVAILRKLTRESDDQQSVTTSDIDSAAELTGEPATNLTSGSTTIVESGDSPEPTGSPAGDEMPGIPFTDAGFAPVVDAEFAATTGQRFDIAISGGRVIDPDSGFDFVANLAINGTKVTAIVPKDVPLDATTTIDATGLVVSPGFIDILSYDPNGYGEWYKIADGVTTNLGMHGINRRAERWFAQHADGDHPLHFGGAYDNAFIRKYEGYDLDPYESAKSNEIAGLVERARDNLYNGYIGLHMEPEYTPGVSYDEMNAHAVLAHELKVPLCVHARYSDNQPPGTNLEAVDELTRIALDTGAHVHIEHINSTGGTGVMAEALQKISHAISQGASITACVYPYTFWATTLKSARFTDWQSKYGITYNDLQVAGTPQRLTKETFDKAYQANKLTAAFAIPQADVDLALQTDFVMIGSDAILETDHNNHPRSTGCFSRVLSEYVRARNIIDLPTALSKMTIQPARLLEKGCPDLRYKGRLGIGADADIVVFDAKTVSDRSTIANPAQESVGVNWVLVEGQVAKNPQGLDYGAKAGRALRYDASSI
ncbi:MAG: amidohydrolase family protein [Acidimicrobiaceae bacterium]|nr:amidohydrolase family protein [Acidimicrobiaceae bacterium]